LFFEYVAEQSLRRRLRRLAPEAAAALRDLFHDREYLVLNGHPETTWRFGPAEAVVPPAAILDGGHEKLSMTIAEDGWCEMLGARAWWDFTGESRLLAWALAHGGLLEGLGRILREPLMPSALTDAALPHSDIALEFSANAANGRLTRGCLSLSAAMVMRLASHPGWQRSTSTAAGWLSVPGTVRFELRGISFPLSELSVSQIGDVLILGNRANCFRNLQVTLVGARSDERLRTWNAQYDGKRVILCAGSANSPMELIMPDPAAAKAADNIPVSLDFDLGTVSLPLGELATLKPGYVFELPGTLEKLRVVIRANGMRVAVGELVAVGNVLGVQLLAIETDGIR
jgi:type III secretion system YscQ/HrcQ family protein